MLYGRLLMDVNGDLASKGALTVIAPLDTAFICDMI